MNVQTQSDNVPIVLDIVNHRTGARESRVATVANVVGIKVILPDGTELIPDQFTVPEAGKIRFVMDLTMPGIHEVVAMLTFEQQLLPTSVYRFPVSHDRYGSKARSYTPAGGVVYSGAATTVMVPA